MKLDKWISKNGYTKQSFGKLVNVSRIAINRYISGERDPRPDVARDIVRVTNGGVTLDDLYGRVK
jgi:DNA-binding XRE family transcriptional regulator